MYQTVHFQQNFWIIFEQFEQTFLVIFDQFEQNSWLQYKWLRNLNKNAAQVLNLKLDRDKSIKFRCKLPQGRHQAKIL